MRPWDTKNIKPKNEKTTKKKTKQGAHNTTRVTRMAQVSPQVGTLWRRQIYFLATFFFFFGAFSFTSGSSSASSSSSSLSSASGALRLVPIRALLLDPIVGDFFSLGALAFFSLFLPAAFLPLLALGFSFSIVSSLVFSSASLSPLNSSSFWASDFGSGAPLVGSFLDPASGSYSPPAFSYSLESFVACRI